MDEYQTNHIRWIFFDWGGVLKDEVSIYRHLAEITAGYLDTRGIEENEQDLFDELIRIERLESRIGLEDLLESKGLSASESAELLSSVNEELHLKHSYEGVEEVLTTLGSKYKLGIISNNNVKGFAKYLEFENYLSHFEVIVGSRDAGVRKPDPGIFHLALEQAACEPHEAAMVGDRLNKDIAGANRVGMFTVQAKQGIYVDQEPAVPEEQPDLLISDVRELLEHFPLK